MTALRGIGWDHPRCMRPLRAGAEVWRGRTGVEIEWQARSLRDFGDQPLEELAGSFDLLSIDHPFVGTAHALGCLAPLDELVPGETLAALAADGVGASHGSYAYAGHQWGLATDAACQVAAIRDDLVPETAPVSWHGVLQLATAQPGRVGIPLVAADAICSYVTLLANAGAPPPASASAFAHHDAGLAAIGMLGALVERGHAECLDLNPPAMLDRMTESDEIVYVPLAFGYTNYSRPGERPFRVRFLDIPSAGHGPIGAMLGGAGLAVSAASEHAIDASAFAAWLSGAEAQREVVAPAGGQPGSRSAWLDATVEELTGGFTSGTLATIESAYVRPRDTWWPPFQRAAGDALNRLLRERAAATEIYEEVERLYGEAIA